MLLMSLNILVHESTQLYMKAIITKLESSAIDPLLISRSDELFDTILIMNDSNTTVFILEIAILA